MSFDQGFEKIAVLGKVVGTLAGQTAKATQGITQGVKNFATKQRIDRVNSYRGAFGKKPFGGAALQGAQARNAVAQGVKKDVAAGKLVGTPELKNRLTAAKAQAAGATRKTQESALGRLDRSNATKAKNKPGFIKKHPFLAAGGVFLGARAMMGGEQQAPPPPPQVVQY